MRRANQSIARPTVHATTPKGQSIFSRLFLVASILLLCSSAIKAQTGGAISGQAVTPGGTPASNARLTVCPYTASGIPCSPQAATFSDSALTVPLPQPFAADQFGNFSFWVATGASYLVQIQVNQTIVYSYIYTVGTSGSGSGVASLNTLTGALSLTSTGSTVTITPSGSTIDLEVAGGGGGTGTSSPGQTLYNNAGAVGGFTTDQALFLDPTGVQETNPTLNAGQGGAKTMTDSNGAGVGIPLGDSWSQIVCATMNIPYTTCNTSPYNAVPINVPGDAAGDNANRAYAGFAPSDQFNPVLWNQYNTNSLDGEGSVTPPATHQFAFVSQTRAAFVHLATSMTDKYLPTAQSVTQTGQSISLAANQAIVTVSNNFFPHQRLLVSGCTILTGLNTFGYVELTGVTSSTITFPFSGTGSNATSTPSVVTDTCTFAPSNPWTLGSGWGPAEVLGSPSQASGPDQGIFYQIGNQLTLSCTTQNLIVQVQNVPATLDTGMRATITVSGGVVQTPVTLNNPGNFGFINGAYLQIGNGAAIVQAVNTPGTFITTGLTLVAGGTGYSASSSAVINANGQLNFPYKVLQFGVGCPNSPSGGLTVSCSIGSGSACGQFGKIAYSPNPQIEITSSASTTMSLGTGTGATSIYVGLGGDVEVIYPAGPGFGGTWQITADGGSPLLDTVSNSTIISEAFPIADGYPYGPRNFGGANSLQDAHFKVTGGVTHNFVITATNTGGSTVGIAEMAVPTAAHNAGVNPPNVVAGGAIPNGNNSSPTCGLGTAGCQKLYSNWLSNLIVTPLKNEGLVVKYYDNQNLDPVSGYFNNGLATNSLQNNIITNSTNSLHMSSSGHRQVAGNALSAAAAAPSPSLFVRANQGLEIERHGNGTDGFWLGSYFANSFNGAPTFSNYAVQGQINQYPQGWGDWFCQFNNPSTSVFIPPPGGNGQATPDCGFGFETNPDSNTSPGVFHSLSSPLTSAQTAPSHAIEMTGTTGNLGVYQVSLTPGTGYTGTPSISWVSDGSCTTYPTATIALHGGGILARLLTQGTCPVGIPTPTISGLSGGTGFSWVLARGGAPTIATQVPGSYAGSGSVTATGGQCPTPLVLGSSLIGGGIVISVTSGNCYIAPTGFTVSGYTGSGFSATFAIPSNSMSILASESRWQQYSMGNVYTNVERNFGTGPALPEADLAVGPSQEGFGVILGNPTTSEFGFKYKVDISQITANITGVPMTTLDATGTNCATATYVPGTGVLKIPPCSGGGSSPLTTKGDLYGFSTVAARIPVGTDTFVLTADSTQALGVKWAAATGGGNTTSTAGTTNSLSKFNGANSIINSLFTDDGTNGAYSGTGGFSASAGGLSGIGLFSQPSFTGRAGTLNLLEGTTPLVTGTVGRVIEWEDSTNHRPIFNPNNAGNLFRVGIATAGTSGDCAQLSANGIDVSDSNTPCNNPYPLVDIQKYFPSAVNVGAMMVACHADTTVLPGWTCDATRAVQNASAVGTSWAISGGNLTISGMQNSVPAAEQVHLVFATTTSLNGDYTIGSRTATTIVVPTASGLTSGTETVTMYPLKNTVDEVARSYNQNEKWPSSGTLYDQTPSTTLATPSAPGLSFAATGGSFPASQNVCATVNYRSGDGVSVRSAETCITTTAGSAGVLTITGPGSCPTYAQGWDANLTLSMVGTLDETLQGNGICGSTVAFTRAILYPSQPAMPTVATGVPAFILYNVNHPLFYADNGANGGFVIKTGPSFNASNIIATGTKGYSTLANIAAYNFSHINMTGCSVFDSAFFVGSVRQGLGAVGTGGTVGNPSCAYKIYGTANDVTFYGMSLNVQDTFGTGLQVQRTPETYGDTEGMGRIGFNSLIVTGTTSTLPLVTLAGIPCGGSTTVNCFGASDFTFIQPSFETTAASSCMTMTDVAGVTLKNPHCQGSGTSFAGATPAYIFTSTAGTSAQYQSSNLDIENPNTVGYATIYQNGINSVNVTVPNNNFAYTGDYHYGAGKLPTDVWQSRPVTSDSTFVFSTANALTLSAMTGTSCLQEVSGVVTATGSACGAGSPAWSALTNPTTTLALSMGNANTTTWTVGAATSTNNMFKWTDTASNTGTGILGWFTTASGSTMIPWQADANGIGFQVTNTGTLKSVGGTAAGSIQLGTDGSGAGTLQLSNGSAAAHTIWASGATTSNTIAGFTAVPVTGHLVTCTVSSTTCTLTDGGAVPTGTVTSVAETFTGGLVSVGGSPITGSGTLALTVAGTSGGIPYFSSASTWASSAALAANAVLIGGGAGAAPSSIAASTTVTNSLFATATGPAFRNIGASDMLFNYVAGGGTAQAQTATYAPAVVALTNGTDVWWLPTAANTAAAPTFAPNGLTAKPITKLGTTALVANDLTTTAIAHAIYDGTEWQLQNPQTTSGGGGGLPTGTTGQGIYYATGGTTGTATSDIIHTGATAGSPLGFNMAVPLNQFDFVGTWGRADAGPATTTTTNGSLTNVATSVTVVSTTGYPTSGYLLIGHSNFAPEFVSYTGTTGTTFTGLTRSLFGTTAANPQSTGADVVLVEENHFADTTHTPAYVQFWKGGVMFYPNSNNLVSNGVNNAGSVGFGTSAYATTFVVGGGPSGASMTTGGAGGLQFANTSSTAIALLNGAGLLTTTGNSVNLTTATTITATSLTTTGLVLPSIPISTTVHGHCSIIWDQNTAVNTVQFGIGGNFAPTNLYVMNKTFPGTTANPVYTTITSATTTAISATTAPGVAATNYADDIDFTLITGGTNPVVLTIYGLTSSGADALVIQPGSSCGWLL